MKKHPVVQEVVVKRQRKIYSSQLHPCRLQTRILMIKIAVMDQQHERHGQISVLSKEKVVNLKMKVLPRYDIQRKL